MWQFFEHQPGRTLVDPIEEAFFATDSDDENARHLVRESIQNSLDAAYRNQTVKVRFTFGELRREFVNELFKDLPEHLEAKGSGLLSPPAVDQGMRFLAIEDFGTSGLVGNPDQLQDNDSDSEDNFFYFWRNVGRSGKRAGSLGKWGLGKTVFPASSRINTFFGLTRRPCDSKSYLLGRCDIKTHRIGGLQYDPYGYYARWEGDKPMPILDTPRIERLREAFHLAREGNDDTPGLSIIIPHVVDEFSVAMLRQEVIENYFWPILKGDLVIEVQENYLTPPETIMNSKWMRNKVKSPAFGQEHRELADTITLAAWAIDHHATIPQVTQPSNRTPRWDEDTKLTVTELEHLIERDDNSEPFAIRVPLWVRPISGPALLSTFLVYGQKVPYTVRQKSYLVRQGINVGRACRTNPPHRIFFVVVESGHLADMMGFAENPSHTNFERTDAIRQGYQRGAMNAIGFVTGSPSAIVRMLDAQNEDSAASLFSDIFWRVPDMVPDPPKRQRRVVVRRGESVMPDVAVERRVRPFELEKWGDGFQIKDNLRRIREIESLTIRAGFDGGRGNPFKSHSRFDFDFSDAKGCGLTIDQSGCKADFIDKNEIRLSEIKKDFSFRISGFDTRRDLQVQATPRMGPQ